MQSVLILENAVLARLARNPAIVEEFPLLRALRPTVVAGAPVKKCCGQKNRPTTAASTPINYEAVRKAIAALPKDRKSRLKQLLNTKEIRVYYFDDQQRKTKYIF
jgi:hypothetical protein